jgi:predicted ATPase
MIIEKIDIVNILGFKKATFHFDSHLNVLYGPNGSGKSSLLYLINIMSNPFQYLKKDNFIFCKRLLYNTDFNPVYFNYKANDLSGNVLATFKDKGQKYEVELDINNEYMSILEDLKNKGKEESQEYKSYLSKICIVKNTLPQVHKGYGFLTNAENPNNTHSFQIDEKSKDIFLDIVQTVYDFPCKLLSFVPERNYGFYTDITIEKKYYNEKVIVHYKRMSDGEKKVSTLFAQLSSFVHRDHFPIYLIDNIEMHVYFNRHIPMIEKINHHFSNKQIIATSHSPILVGLKGYLNPYLKNNQLICVDSQKI